MSGTCWEIGQKYGKARAKSLSAFERKQIATKASKAAAKAKRGSEGQEALIKDVSG